MAAMNFSSTSTLSQPSVNAYSFFIDFLEKFIVEQSMPLT